MHYGRVKDLILTARSLHDGKPVNNKRTRRLHVSRYESPTDSPKDPRAVFELRYHGTTVIKWYPDGMVKASLSGWDTMSTHACISEESPISIHSSGGSMVGRSGSIVWPGCERTWFCSKNGTLCRADGSAFPVGRFVHAPKPIPKRRSALTHTLFGDVLLDGKGQHWICQDAEGSKVLIPYFGDHELNRKFAISSSELGVLDVSSALEGLVRAATGWSVAERFIYKDEKGGS